MKQHQFFSFLSLLWLMNSCASIPVATMQPVNIPTTFNWGSEVVTFKENGLILQVAYVRSTDEHYIFDVEVQNASSYPQLVSPEDFFYQIMLADSLPPQDNRFPAINPEIKLLEINKTEARENAEERTSYLLELTSAVTNTAADLATINQEKTEEEIDRIEAERAERRNDFEQEERERAFYFHSLNEQRDYWENRMFRKTHIPHGFSLKGRVAFYRLNNKYPFLKFTFQAGDENFEVAYEQKLIHPNDPSQ